MPVDVRTEIVIHRPLSEVSEYVCDPENAPEWYVNIRESRWVSEPGVRLGAQAAFVAFFLGKKLEYTYEFARYEEGKLLAMTTAQGPFPMTTEYAFEPVGEEGKHTKLTLRNHGEPSGFSKVMAPRPPLVSRLRNRLVRVTPPCR